MDTEKKVLDKVLNCDIDNENKKVLFDFYFEMRAIKKGSMVKVLNLLDELSEDCETKKIIRGEILDSFNELPRKTLKMIDKLL